MFLAFFVALGFLGGLLTATYTSPDAFVHNLTTQNVTTGSGATTTPEGLCHLFGAASLAVTAIVLLTAGMLAVDRLHRWNQNR